MFSTPDLDPMAMGYKAYRDGVDPVEGNPFDAGEQSGEWDDWADGWATARLEDFEPWMREVNAKIGTGVVRVADFGACFDDRMTPEEAIEENRVEAEKKAILDSTDQNK